MVQQRREPLFPVTLGCLTHSLERAGRVGPALSPGRVVLGRVPLGPLPSLPRLRGRFLGSVQRLRWYYEAVRLPLRVHHRRMSSDLPMRSAACAADTQGISRLPCEMFPYMPEVFDCAGPVRLSPTR